MVEIHKDEQILTHLKLVKKREKSFFFGVELTIIFSHLLLSSFFFLPKNLLENFGANFSLFFFLSFSLLAI